MRVGTRIHTLTHTDTHTHSHTHRHTHTLTHTHKYAGAYLLQYRNHHQLDCILHPQVDEHLEDGVASSPAGSIGQQCVAAAAHQGTHNHLSGTQERCCALTRRQTSSISVHAGLRGGPVLCQASNQQHISAYRPTCTSTEQR
eukprot:1155687-Pelagomonas_calceolata.AAC.2